MKLGKLIGQGRTAEIYEISKSKVLKLFRPSFPMGASDYEYRIVSKLSNQKLPIPNAEEVITVNNRKGIIYERIYGPTMMQVIASNPLRMKNEAKRMAELHRSIQVNIEFDFPSQRIRTAENIKKTNLLNDELKDALLEKLHLLPNESFLCHGDFHPDNIIVSKDKLWVIDWTNATVGDLFSDIARTKILLKYAVLSGHEPWFMKVLISKVRLKFYNEYFLQYLRLVDGKKHDIDVWEAPVAASRLVELIPQKEKDLLIERIKKLIE